MSNKYVFFGLIAAVVILVFATGGGAYEANQLLAKQSTRLVALKLKDKDLTAQKLSLVRAEQDITKYAPLETVAKTIVPQDKDQAEAVREIVNIGSGSGISLSSITFSASTLGQARAIAPVNGVAGVAALPSTKLTQVTPVVGIPGVYDLQINLQQSADSPVSYDSFINFLTKLEGNRRTAQVSSINLQPDPKNHSRLTFTLTLDEYLKP
jgi:hypothetical protein